MFPRLRDRRRRLRDLRLNLLEPQGHLLKRRKLLRMRHAAQRHFQHQARIRRKFHFPLRVRQHPIKLPQLGKACHAGELLQIAARVIEEIQIPLRRLRNLQDNQIPRALHQFHAKEAQIMAFADQLLHQREHVRRSMRQDRGEKGVQQALPRKAKHMAHFALQHGFAAIADDLIEQRFGVADAPAGRFRQQRQAFFADGHLLMRRDFSEQTDNFRRRAGFEFEFLAARQNCHRNFPNFSRRHDEDDVAGRLFKRFQQRVERLFGEHVDFNNDEDFVAAARRRVADIFLQDAHVVHAAIRGRVNLLHVHRIAVRDFAAKFAGVAGRRRGAMLAIQGFR